MVGRNGGEDDCGGAGGGADDGVQADGTVAPALKGQGLLYGPHLTQVAIKF